MITSPETLFQTLVPFALIFAIMYFLILRPQQKRAKQHQEMVKNVRRGDWLPPAPVAGRAGSSCDSPPIPPEPLAAPGLPVNDRIDNVINAYNIGVGNMQAVFQARLAGRR